MSETKHSTLLPCPFCGDTDPSMAETGVFWLRCTSCTAEGAPFDTEAEAIAAWNTRAATSLHHELVSALEQARKRIAYLGMVAAGRHQEANEATVLPKIDAVLAKAKQPNLDEPRG